MNGRVNLWMRERDPVQSFVPTESGPVYNLTELQDKDWPGSLGEEEAASPRLKGFAGSLEF